MCGIIGYTGKNNAVPVILQSLSALEYRGYDSAGAATFCRGRINRIRRTGKLENLKNTLNDGILDGECGIGHTRWATHGEVSECNAHPHRTGKTVIVHNGIIENYASLESFASAPFESTTDTERACAVFNHFYDETNNGIEAVKKACEKFNGFYAFLVMFETEPDVIYAVKNGCPLSVGEANEGFAACSDVAACDFTKYYKLFDGEISKITKQGVTFYDKNGCEIQKEALAPKTRFASPDKCGYPHFMLKEIEEIPTVLKKTVTANLKDGLPYFEGIDDEVFKNINFLRIVGCGTAYHAGLVAEHLLRSIAGIEGGVYIASEYRYTRQIIKEGECVIFISQSGETADTLACVRMCKQKGAYTLGVINVPSSTAAEECDGVILTHAGSEIAVASTKAYVTQLAVLYLIVLKTALVKGALSEEEVRRLCAVLTYEIPTLSRLTDTEKNNIYSISEKYASYSDFFYIGRGIDSVLCSEASLKLKEISYIHSEAYPSGELKHGTISLITEGVGVFAIATDDELFAKTLGNVEEASARGGDVILLCDNKLKTDKNYDIIPCEIPEKIFAPFIVAPRFQYFSYCVTTIKDLDPDMPRNLAKSVTVE